MCQHGAVATEVALCLMRQGTCYRCQLRYGPACGSTTIQQLLAGNDHGPVQSLASSAKASQRQTCAILDKHSGLQINRSTTAAARRDRAQHHSINVADDRGNCNAQTLRGAMDTKPRRGAHMWAASGTGVPAYFVILASKK